MGGERREVLVDRQVVRLKLSFHRLWESLGVCASESHGVAMLPEGKDSVVSPREALPSECCATRPPQNILLNNCEKDCWLASDSVDECIGHLAWRLTFYPQDPRGRRK